MDFHVSLGFLETTQPWGLYCLHLPLTKKLEIDKNLENKLQIYKNLEIKLEISSFFKLEIFEVFGKW